jgi:hypothetical protein
MTISSTITPATETKGPQVVVNTMMGKRIVVLVTSPSMYDRFSGVVLYSDVKDRPVGHFREDWNRASFKPWRGEINLKVTP